MAKVKTRGIKIFVPEGIEEAFEEINRELKLWTTVQQFLLWAARTKIVEVKTNLKKDLSMEVMQV